MGPELALAATAIGTGLQLKGQYDQRKKQQGILRQSAQDATRTQAKATDMAVEGAQDMSGQQRLADMQAAEAAIAQRTQDDLQGAGAGLIDTAQDEGSAVSMDFLRGKADRALAEGERMSAVARELAKMRSAGDVQNDRSRKQAALAESLGSMWTSQRGRSSAAANDAEGVGMPWYGTVGQIASSVGTGSLMGTGLPAGFGGAKAAADYSLPAAELGLMAGRKSAPKFGWMGRS